MYMMLKAITSMVTNIIIGISVLTLSLDYANKIIAELLDMLMKLASFILVMIVTILIKFLEDQLAAISEKLRNF